MQKLQTRHPFSPVIAALFFSAAFFAAAPLSAKVYFVESFRNYADTAPGTATNLASVGNDPIWADAAELDVKLPAGGAAHCSAR